MIMRGAPMTDGFTREVVDCAATQFCEQSRKGNQAECRSREFAPTGSRAVIAPAVGQYHKWHDDEEQDEVVLIDRHTDNA